MVRGKRFGRPVDGVLILNKSLGLSSNHALQQAKRLLAANKAGHTGSLDPAATGVLPLCFGEATKFSHFLLTADKRYRSTFRLGMATSTGDAEGEVIRQESAAGLTLADVRAALQQFRGNILQVPPMVSALKHQGQPLYKLARAGVEVERPARSVTVFQLDLLDFRPGAVAELDVELHCSKGTYVRSIAEDLGQSLGVGGHVSALHRSGAGPFSERQAVRLEALIEERGDGEPELLDHHLLPIESLLQHLPRLVIGHSSSHYFRHGNAVMDLEVYRLGKQGDTVRVCLDDGRFLGVGEITDDGKIAPRRLVVPAG